MKSSEQPVFYNDYSSSSLVRLMRSINSNILEGGSTYGSRSQETKRLSERAAAT